MKLADYLTQAEMTQTAFAEIAGVSITAVNRAITGQREPGRFVARRIVGATEGRVEFEDLWPSSPVSGGAQ